MEGSREPDGLSDSERVAAVLRDLDESMARWEADLATAGRVTYSVDMGDIRAVANADGKLIDLVLHPDVMVVYTHDELAQRLNVAFSALRDEAKADYEARYGIPPCP